MALSVPQISPNDYPFFQMEKKLFDHLMDNFVHIILLTSKGPLSNQGTNEISGTYLWAEFLP